MQRGDLLNRLKLEMNYTLNYYRKLYESLIASTIRKELIEKKKIIKLQNKYKSLEDEINDLENEINEKEQLFLKREKEENEKEEQASIDHNEAMKVLKFDNENKTNQAIKILTTPKEEIILGK